MVSAPRQSLTALIAIDSLEPCRRCCCACCSHQLGETISALELMPRLALDFVLEYLPDAHDPLVRPLSLVLATASRHGPRR
jgi:hypothetical protein